MLTKFGHRHLLSTGAIKSIAVQYLSECGWTANYGDSTVTEIDSSTGALAKRLKSVTYGFDSPMAVSSNGADVWVCNEEDQTVTGFPA